MPGVDRVISTLIRDLEDRGMLESTLVVLATEFGRSPRINGNSGRDHFPKAYSVLMAGGGLRSGIVHGSTDERAAEVQENLVDAPALNATIGFAMGLPIDKKVFSSNRRPFQMNGGENREPVRALFG